MSSNRPLDGAPLLSVVVITLNEERNLPRLLRAVSAWADEIVVFDSGSTDATVELALAAGAKVVNCPWEGWSATKNKANATARGQWILSLDADEAPDAECAAAIQAHVQGGKRSPEGLLRVGEVNRMTNYCGQWVRHSGWFPDRNIRLWPRGTAEWSGAIHESPSFEEKTETTRLSGIVEHHSYPQRADHLSQIEKFGKVWAEDQFASGSRRHWPWLGSKSSRNGSRPMPSNADFSTVGQDGPIARLSAWATWRKHARLRALYRHDVPSPRKILVARTDALGDLVLTLPLLHALRDHFPSAQLDLLVRPYAEAVAQAALQQMGVLLWTDEMAQRRPRERHRISQGSGLRCRCIGLSRRPSRAGQCRGGHPHAPRHRTQAAYFLAHDPPELGWTERLWRARELAWFEVVDAIGGGCHPQQDSKKSASPSCSR